MYPDDQNYSKQHEWVRVSGDVGLVGITEYARKALGDIVYVELPSLGKKVRQNEQIAVVESSNGA